MKVRDILGLIGDNYIQVWKMVDKEDLHEQTTIYEGQANSYDQDEDLFITNIYAVDYTICLEVE